MKIASGACTIHEVERKLEKIIDEYFDNNIQRAIREKMKDEFYEVLLCKSFVFYVPSNSIKANMIDASLDEISKIIYVDRISEIIALVNLPTELKKRYKISWIAVEFDQTNMEDFVSERELSKILPFISTACELDTLKKNTEKKKVAFRIDFKRLESAFQKTMFKPDRFVRDAKKYFFQSIFNFQISDQKNNEIPYIHQTLAKKSYADIEITKEDLKSVFLYRCQVCNKQHEVILSSSMRDKKGKKRRYTRVSEDFINLQNGRCYIVCDHIGTPYEGIEKYFSIDIKKHIGDNELDLDKVFIFMFSNFVNDGNGSIEFYLPEKDEVNSISVDEFLKKI